jgi:hypothetical protein
MLGGEIMVSGGLEPGVGQYLKIGPSLPRQIPARVLAPGHAGPDL